MLDNDMSRLEKAITQQIVLEDLVEAVEGDLKRAKSRLNNQNTVEVPTAMTLAGVSEFTTVDGQKVKVAPFVSGSIDKEDPEPAYEALRDAGEESIIKWTITLSFGRDEQDRAENAFNFLVENSYQPTKILAVHHSALGAALRRHFMDPGFPLTTLFHGLAGRKAKITRPKRKP